MTGRHGDAERGERAIPTGCMHARGARIGRRAHRAVRMRVVKAEAVDDCAVCVDSDANYDDVARYEIPGRSTARRCNDGA